MFPPFENVMFVMTDEEELKDLAFLGHFQPL